MNPETRFSTTFSACKDEGRAALVAFITAGDPTPGETAGIPDALVAGGTDVIELGMPSTDPMADGQVIQAANLRSLDAGTRTADIFAIVNFSGRSDKDIYTVATAMGAGI